MDSTPTAGTAMVPHGSHPCADVTPIRRGWSALPRRVTWRTRGWRMNAWPTWTCSLIELRTDAPRVWTPRAWKGLSKQHEKANDTCYQSPLIKGVVNGHPFTFCSVTYLDTLSHTPIRRAEEGLKGGRNNKFQQSQRVLLYPRRKSGCPEHPPTGWD